MMRALRVAAFNTLLAATPVLSVDVPVPGGIDAVAHAIGIPSAPDPARLVAEIVRAVYADSSISDSADSRAVRLAAHLTLAGRRDAGRSDRATELVPIPLTLAVWSDAVFHRPVAPGELFAAVTGDRNAALLAYGLAALDDETLQFFVDHPAVVARLYRHDAAVFASFAEHLHIHASRVVVPGGDRAAALWEALLEARVGQPDRFVGRLFARDGGRSAYLFDTIGHLDAPRAAFALGAWIADESVRLDRFKALAAAANEVYPQWSPRRSLFRRPPHDVLSMFWRLHVTTAGQPAFPAWRNVVDAFGARADRTGGARAFQASGTSVDAAWLVETTLRGDARARGNQLDLLAFGERTFGGVDAVAMPDALAVLGLFPRYQVLMLTLERAGVRRPAVYLAVARHAGRLSHIDGPRAHSALAQFQGALALVERLARVRTIDGATLDGLLETLAAVRISHDRYAGALAQWVQSELRRALPNGAEMEPLLLSALAGPSSTVRRAPISWEGRQYRFDLVTPEAQRLRRIRDRLDAPSIDDVLSSLTAIRESADEGEASEDELFDRVDVPLGEALLALAYAVDLGDPDGSARLARNLARRHNFGTEGRKDDDSRARAAWALPRQMFNSGGPWHVDGAAVGLDIALAPLALRRLSRAPPSKSPTLSTIEREAFAVSLVLMNPIALDDAARDAIAEGVARGQRRIAALADGDEDATALGRQIGMDGQRLRALRWTIDHDRQAVGSFFSIVERLALGGGNVDLHAWGMSALSSAGCLCTELVMTGRATSLVGRPQLGLLSTAAADLNLRIAIVLRELELPAALAPSVLAYAVRDFIDEVQPIDFDDWLTLVRGAQAVSRERIEDYIAAATAGGPLVGAAAITMVRVP
jgi:hypothetical protein